MIENENIKIYPLKLHHEWPALHLNTTFINYKDPIHHFSLDNIVDNRFTDKNTFHSYLNTYEKIMKDKSLTCKNILEYPIQKGGSLKLWHDYFVNANIYGIDSYVPTFLKEYKRINCLKMDINSQDCINYFLNKKIEFDFIIYQSSANIDYMSNFIKTYIQLLVIEGEMIIENIPDINWCERFKILLPDNFSYEVVDLRHVKNRLDDILFIIRKNKTKTPLNLKINYGTDNFSLNITDLVLSNYTNESGIIYIPPGDENRGKLFGDPLFGTIKKIFIKINDNKLITLEDKDYAYIDIVNNKTYINEEYLTDKINNQLTDVIKPNEKFIEDDSSKIQITLKKFNLVVLSIFKNETMNLQIWLEHYLWQGIEHFYLIDNGSVDNPLEILQDYIDKGLVSYYYRPEKYQQVQHYQNIYDKEKLYEKTKWLCICDLDEFFFGTNKPLVDNLNDFDKYDVIYSNSFFYGSDNLVEHPKDIRTSILYREEEVINGTKYIFKPSSINNSSEIWIHWLVNSGTSNKKIMNEIFEHNKIRLNHYRIQSLNYFKNVKMTRGDVSLESNETIRDIKYFEHYTKIATIKDDILKQIVENGYDYKKITNTALIVEPKFLKHLPFVINDFKIKLGISWQIVFYCGKGFKKIWINLLDKDIEIRELDKVYLSYNEYSDFMKSSELWNSLYGTYVLVFSSNSLIKNTPPYNIDYFIDKEYSYIGANQSYIWTELQKDKIYFNNYNFQGGLSLRNRLDMVKIINNFGVKNTITDINIEYNLENYAEDIYFTVGCYYLNLRLGNDFISNYFSVHCLLQDDFFGINSLEPG
jgi:hypothetical protein